MYKEWHILAAAPDHLRGLEEMIADLILQVRLRLRLLSVYVSPARFFKLDDALAYPPRL